MCVVVHTSTFMTYYCAHIHTLDYVQFVSGVIVWQINQENILRPDFIIYFAFTLVCAHRQDLFLHTHVINEVQVYHILRLC